MEEVLLLYIMISFTLGVVVGVFVTVFLLTEYYGKRKKRKPRTKT